MADRIRFAVSAIPIETLTDENSGTHDVIAGEVLKQLGGSGDSLSLTAYNGTAANQGYLNATVNYSTATHAAGGTALSATEGDFIFIKNTGYKFSDATTLGASTTDCVIVALHTIGYSDGAQDGWYNGVGVADDHYFELAFLKPGQAIVLPLGAKNLSITQFGDTANDFTYLNNQGGQTGISKIVVKTVVAAGTAAASGNAVEYLVVT